MGKQYCTINTLRSAISMTHDEMYEEVDGMRVGQHPLVSRFLKGVFNCRPPAPRCSTTWLMFFNFISRAFQTMNKPATIGHWLKSVMHIDTNIFLAHSTRGAATSKARSPRVSAADTLKAASWSSISTFSRFYHRPIDSGQFGRGVLKQQFPTPVSFKRYHVVN